MLLVISVSVSSLVTSILPTCSVSLSISLSASLLSLCSVVLLAAAAVVGSCLSCVVFVLLEGDDDMVQKKERGEGCCSLLLGLQVVWIRRRIAYRQLQQQLLEKNNLEFVLLWSLWDEGGIQQRPKRWVSKRSVRYRLLGWANVRVAYDSLVMMELGRTGQHRTGYHSNAIIITTTSNQNKRCRASGCLDQFHFVTTCRATSKSRRAPLLAGRRRTSTRRSSSSSFPKELDISNDR
jgi:hypothetical protein